MGEVVVTNLAAERSVCDALREAAKLIERLDNGVGCFFEYEDQSYADAMCEEYRELRGIAARFLSEHGSAIALADLRP